MKLRRNYVVSLTLVLLFVSVSTPSNAQLLKRLFGSLGGNNETTTTTITTNGNGTTTTTTTTTKNITTINNGQNQTIHNAVTDGCAAWFNKNSIRSDERYGSEIGYLITVDFGCVLCNGREILVETAFLDSHNNPVPSVRGSIYSFNGQVYSGVAVTPSKDYEEFAGVEIFIPYSALKNAKTSKGKYQCLFYMDNIPMPGIAIGDIDYSVMNASNASTTSTSFNSSGSKTGRPMLNLASSKTTAQTDYLFVAEITSSTQIKEQVFSINGETSRGMKVVSNESGTSSQQKSSISRFEKRVKLRPGENQLMLTVTNEAGSTTMKETITCTQNAGHGEASKDVQIISAEMKRLALVIGNASYPGQPLKNPLNDAADVSAKLKKLGFDVMTVTDASKRTMDEAICKFGEKAFTYDVALFYYAGHGIQHDGRNYLIPVNAHLSSPGDIEYDCTDAGRIMSKLEESKCGMNIIVLDACRNNPFERSWTRGALQGAGLSMMTAPVGSFIAYATSPGSVAQDGSTRNSPYTSAFLKALDKPGLDIFRFFQDVQSTVMKSTDNLQVPWTASSFTGDFYFNRD